MLSISQKNKRGEIFSKKRKGPGAPPPPPPPLCFFCVVDPHLPPWRSPSAIVLPQTLSGRTFAQLLVPLRSFTPFADSPMAHLFSCNTFIWEICVFIFSFQIFSHFALSRGISFYWCIKLEVGSVVYGRTFLSAPRQWFGLRENIPSSHPFPLLTSLPPNPWMSDLFKLLDVSQGDACSRCFPPGCDWLSFLLLLFFSNSAFLPPCFPLAIDFR